MTRAAFRALAGAAVAIAGVATGVVAMAGAAWPAGAQEAVVEESAAPVCVAPAATLRLDHVPIAVDDLEALSDRLAGEFGFRAQPPLRHDANGLITATIPFADGTRLELRTVGTPQRMGDAAGPGTTEVIRYAEVIRDGGGGAFVGFSATSFEDAVAAAREMEEGIVLTGTGAGRRAGFPADHPLHPVLLVAPEVPGRAARPEEGGTALAHPNGASGLEAVWVMVEDPPRLTRFLLAFGARDCGVSRHPAHLYGRAVGVRGGTVHVVDARLWLADPGSAPVVSLTVSGGPDSVADGIVLGNAGGLWVELRPGRQEGTGT